jgi:DNA-binding XRE family transcriptional regulator
MRNTKFYFETTILLRQKCFRKVWPQKSEQLWVYGLSANLPIDLNWLHRRRCNKCSLVPYQEEDADAVGLRRETVNRWEKDVKHSREKACYTPSLLSSNRTTSY